MAAAPLPSAPGAGPAVELAGVISLAGVLDLGAAAREKLGNGAATELMGGAPGELPERYAVADPLSQVPIPAAVRCVHAQADDRVPFAQSVTYVAAARAAGSAELREQPPYVRDDLISLAFFGSQFIRRT